MNYEGRVTSLNPTALTFELDNKINVHTGHLATTTDNRLPEIGEHVKIYNAHFMVTSTNKLEKLFVCDRGKILCDNYTTADDSTFLELIDEYSLGCSDLHAIDTNTSMIKERISIQQSALEIIFEIVRGLADVTKNKHGHKCLNKVIAPLTMRTVSDYHFVDLYRDKDEKMPIWFFGSHSKGQTDKLLGFLQINKRYGMFLLKDSKRVMPCVVLNTTNINMLDLLNKFVVIKDFRVFTEVYREDQVPCLEYIFFDVKDILALQNVHHDNVQRWIVDELPEDFPYVYKFKFKLLKKATVNINKHSEFECWLEVLLLHNDERIYLGLNAYQVQITPLLQEGHVYEVHHTEKLLNAVNTELTRIKPHAVLKIQEKTSIFVHISGESSGMLSIADIFEEVINDSVISVQGIVGLKKLTPALSSRTTSNSTLKEFGTPGTYTHSLALEDDKGDYSIFLYLNNWENLQMPLGLIPGMRVGAKNVLFNKKYLRSTALTSFEVLSYEPPVLFDTVNLCKNLDRGCDKYSYLGWGDLIPTNVLVWSRVSIIYVRSLKIKFNCSGCPNECSCPIDTTMTFYVHDEFGSALVISSNLDLLRLILGLEPEQWKLWCSAFKEIKVYVYNDLELIETDDLNVKLFCEALNMVIQTNNACKMSNLELKCRKLDGNPDEDSGGMPLWYCVDARVKEWSM